jgi:hypothetical protein
VEASLAGKSPYLFGAYDLLNFGRAMAMSLLYVHPAYSPIEHPYIGVNNRDKSISSLDHIREDVSSDAAAAAAAVSSIVRGDSLSSGTNLEELSLINEEISQMREYYNPAVFGYGASMLTAAVFVIFYDEKLLI